jgi:hypothetical protein
MRSAPTGPRQDTATGDIPANLSAFGRSLRAANRSEPTVDSYGRRGAPDCLTAA